ncbi:MAG: FtsQ-type POTRA domain-containing protein [Desulfobulbaceae bacterium]|nr:FtsQ-type POTRA domain-containing protein [Desulfobulbaceae bacterium]
MKKPTSLQKLFAWFTGKKSSSFQNASFRPVSMSGLSDSYGQKRNRVARIKQWMVHRNKSNSIGYRPPPARNRIRSRLIAVLSFVLVVTLVVSFDGVTRLKDKLKSIDLFHIDSFEITGNSIVSAEVIRETTGLVMHQSSMLGIRKNVLEQKLCAVPWIASAEIKKNWPSAIEIGIKEHIPLALLHKGSSSDPQLYYMDKYGFSFLPVTPGGDVDYPVITGLQGISDEKNRKLALAEALVFLKKVRRNDPHLPAHSVSEVHIDSAGELVVYLVDYPFPIFFGNGNSSTIQKYDRLVQVLKALYKKEKGKKLISAIEYIQMDYLQDKVLVAQTGSE